MSSVKTIDLGLTGYDELFMTDEGRAENRLSKIYDLPLTEIDDFPDHPYKVKLDEDMDQLVQSVKERGVLTPITVREKEDGRYEVVSGHRRKKACELAGLETIRADIKDLTRDESIVLMVESNYQRSSIMPSEKAFAYKMRMEAMKRQGQRTDLTYSPLDNKLKGVTSASQIGGTTGDSQPQIYRYIRLTELLPDLLDSVDDGKIALRPAVELSYLTKDEQQSVVEAIRYMDCTPSHVQAIKLRKLSQEGKLTRDIVDVIMGEEKPNQKEKYTFQAERLRKFIPQSIPFDKTEDYILKALEYYQRYQQRQRESRDAR